MHIVVIQAYLGSNHAYGAESLCTNKLIKALSAVGGTEVTVVCYPDAIRHAGVNYVEIPMASEGKYGVLCRNFLHSFPGGGLPWARRAADAVMEIHSRKPVDVLHTRSQPLETHFAGMLVAEKIPLVWLAYFSDPVPSPGYEGSGLRNRLIAPFFGKFHSKIVGLCDDAGYPSERLIRYVKDHQWNGAAPRHGTGFTLPHILPEPPSQSRSFGLGKTVMLHCGKFYEQGRHPYKLLEAMASLAELHPELRENLIFVQMGDHFPGMITAAEKLGIGGMIHHGGSVTPDIALEYCAGAEALVLIEHETMEEGIYFPSKLSDYLAMGKPVLALTPESSVVSDILGSAYPFRADPWDVQGIHAALANLCGHLTLLPPSAGAPAVPSARVDTTDLQGAEVARRFVAHATAIRQAKPSNNR